MTDPTSIEQAKALAKSLRKALAAEGVIVGHSEALEQIARQQGARDWNTLAARLAKAGPSPAFSLHQKVRGRYLGQTFEGVVTTLAKTGPHYALTIRFDEPVDVVRFESFSNIRRTVRGVVDQDGRSIAKTSDGAPHLLVSALGGG
ncbi:glyoxalase superfamily protein [Oryzifoliimicrobium ureilyticus]|uniref:glyoxalase superfamily protein n=1 Tax=Oryzifoliimicrobium ureilyticus TaxID=3113724 RepID=UPI0030768093